MKHNTMTAIVLAAGLAGGLALQANAGDQKAAGMHNAEWTKSWQQSFDKADKNSDDSLSASEYSTFQAELESNRKDKYAEDNKGIYDEKNKARQTYKSHAFDDVDTDDNNKVSRDELSVAFAGDVHGMTNMADKGKHMSSDKYAATPAMDKAAGDKYSSSEANVPLAPNRDLAGRDVKNLRGEDVGEIDELVINRTSNEVYAVISVGGFMGIGDKDVAIPLKDLTVGSDDAVLMSQKSEEQLKNMPAYNPSSFKALE